MRKAVFNLNFTRTMLVYITKDEVCIDVVRLNLDVFNAEEICEIIGYDFATVQLRGYGTVLKEIEYLYQKNNIPIEWDV